MSAADVIRLLRNMAPRWDSQPPELPMYVSGPFLNPYCPGTFLVLFRFEGERKRGDSHEAGARAKRYCRDRWTYSKIMWFDWEEDSVTVCVMVIEGVMT